MQVLWTSHLKIEAEREQFRDMVHSSSKVIARLRDICGHKLQSLENPSETDFDSPAWAQKVAHNLGQRKVLAELIQLLTTE